MSSKNQTNGDDYQKKAYPKFSSRLLALVKKHNLNNKQFAELIKISENASTNYLRKGRLPTAVILTNISSAFKVSIDWLLQDVKKCVSNEQSFDSQSKIGFDDDQNIEKNVEDAAAKYGDDLNYLLEMTQEILISNTDYAESLAANIKSFHKSVINEKRLNKMEARMTAFENATTRKISALEKELSENRKKKDRRKNEEPYNGEERRTGLADRRISNKL